MAMKNISEDIRRTINREIDIGTKSVTKSFHSQPVMAATEGMAPEEQESLIDPFLSVEFRLLSIKVLCPY